MASEYAAALAAPPAAGTLVLEPLAERHRTALKIACAEDLAIWPTYPVSYDPEHFDASFDALLTATGRIMFAIVEADRLIGMTGYLGLDGRPNVLEIGSTYIVPAVRGTGFNGRLKRLMIGHAFACGIRRVEFRIDDRNARSKAAVVKIGGVFEGILRADRITWTGHVRDTALFSILKEEWR